MNKEVAITITLKKYEKLLNTKKKYEELKEVIDNAIKYIEKFIPIDEDTILMKERQRDHLLDILKEVKTC